MIQLIKWGLKLGFLKDHRRKIAIVVFVASAVIEMLTSDTLAGVCSDGVGGVCGWLVAMQPKLLLAGSYIGTVGEVFKKDAKGRPKKK